MFGQEYNKERMENAIKVAQLTRDLEILGNGINTVIGERGVNISGGQKARISLARAVYSNADIVLLDDPLSAVDPEVANRIFNECILGALKHKLVILVTHQLQFLQKCPKILLIKEGKVAKLGSYAEITATGFNIKDILDTFNQTMKTGNSAGAKEKHSAEKKVEEKPKEALSKVETTTQATQGAVEKKQADLVVAEERLDGNVGWQDYKNLFSFSIGVTAIFLYIFVALAASVVQLGPSWSIAKLTALSLEEQQ